jgi:hypothetical protein
MSVLGSNFNPQDTQILRLFLRLKFPPALTSAKLKRFEIGSLDIEFWRKRHLRLTSPHQGGYYEKPERRSANGYLRLGGITQKKPSER